MTYPHLAAIIPNSIGPAITFETASVENSNAEVLSNSTQYNLEIADYGEYAFNYYCK